MHTDATARLSDQVDGQLRTINELNNIVSDHERTICKRRMRLIYISAHLLSAFSSRGALQLDSWVT